VAREPSEHESQKARLCEAYTPNQPLDVAYCTEEGNAAEEILAAAETIGCDLIVMGTHGRKGWGRLLAGSIAETVLRKAHCPVLALRRQETPRRDETTRVVVHPTDFSVDSEAALRVARLLAHDLQTRLVILHVTPPVAALEGTTATDVAARADRDCLELVRRRVEGPDLIHRVEIRLEQGAAATEVLRVAQEVGCDLIVMGTHGRTGLGRVLMGSVAEDVLRGTGCPVLAVKGPRPAATAHSNLTTAAGILGNEEVKQS
jgi:nucleotide-binding universal stress UspA family protein